VLLVSGDTQSNGWDAVTASFPDGVVFSG
jgi:hypothetical protein